MIDEPQPFVSRPVTISAVQVTEQNMGVVCSWAGGRDLISPSEIVGEVRHGFEIPTLEGPMSAHVGDWVIRGTEGEFYPCKDSVFRRKYRPPRPTPNVAEFKARVAEFTGIDDADERFTEAAMQNPLLAGRALLELLR